ncbi:hypothetical protein ACFO25_16885 [Paenactinomyces guangxiensis]|uniref:Uncharacterized protein n=1 Tax=Paenactinomyces guangxiensis TaxID=1490290 RepID=A0A7W1WUR8_9BACL|nr:hypothetical protein [Paenactinomyces guangxiensis]MBA4496433.1 hypothetical protein [Paenactinomyces guangxiensis]MBH8593534.1 hypothetical protein [Paenactinomyces guangxiensis]
MSHLMWPVRKEHECKEKLLNVINELGLFECSIYIAGSYFFTAKKTMHFINGNSDIDVLVVCPVNGKTRKALLQVLPVSVVHGFMDQYFGIANFTYQYGQGRNAFNIKFMSKQLFREITELGEIQFKSFRSTSLKGKELIKFYCNNVSWPPHIFRYEELKNPWGYTLLYRFQMIQDGLIYLSDIHSMVLFSICIQDGCNVRELKEKMMIRMKEYTEQCRTREDVLNMFRYFYLRDLMDARCEEALLRFFWNNGKSD